MLQCTIGAPALMHPPVRLITQVAASPEHVLCLGMPVCALWHQAVFASKVVRHSLSKRLYIELWDELMCGVLGASS